MTREHDTVQFAMPPDLLQFDQTLTMVEVVATNRQIAQAMKVLMPPPERRKQCREDVEGMVHFMLSMGRAAKRGRPTRKETAAYSALRFGKCRGRPKITSPPEASQGFRRMTLIVRSGLSVLIPTSGRQCHDSRLRSRSPMNCSAAGAAKSGSAVAATGTDSLPLSTAKSAPTFISNYARCGRRYARVKNSAVTYLKTLLDSPS